MAGQKKKPAFHFNVGIIMFLLILVYLMGHLFMLLFREDLAIYEVVQSQIEDCVQATGLILRDETIVKAKKSGYLNYYTKESERVAKNGLVYTCDETGEVHDYISNLMNQEEKQSSEDYSDIEEEIVKFQEDYTDSQFQTIYSLKYNLESKAMQMGDTILAEHMDEIESKMGSDSFVKYYSKESGLVYYLEDGYENKKVSDLKKEDFDEINYTKTELKSTDKVEAGTSVYRLTTGTDWQVVVPLSDSEYKRLKDREKVTVLLTKDNLSVRCPITFEKLDGDYYAVLSFTKYLDCYAKERYLDVEIEIESEDGLKIPESSIVEVPCYKIPKDFFTGNVAAQKDIVMRKENSKGKVTFETKTVTIRKSESGETDDDPGYYYILAEDVPENTVICKENSTETLELNKTVKLSGVYNVNRGYAIFRYVDVIMENEDYSIVRSGAGYSISLFDRIVLNGDTVQNNQTIY
jgi:hypothetical protein